jgi:hypothetical protein
MQCTVHACTTLFLVVVVLVVHHIGAANGTMLQREPDGLCAKLHYNAIHDIEYTKTYRFSVTRVTVEHTVVINARTHMYTK